MKSKLIILYLLISINFNLYAVEIRKIAIITKPQLIEQTSGVFNVSIKTSINFSENLSFMAKQLKGYLEPALGYDLLVKFWVFRVISGHISTGYHRLLTGSFSQG